jgi:predicted DNA-binding protein YlxM (UPF0122 family)
MSERKYRQSPYLHFQQEWKEKYDSGMSFTKIGKEYGVAYTTVQTVLRGVVKPRPKKQYAHKVPEWINLYKQGWSCNEIADKESIFVGTVSKYLKEAGIELRGSHEREKQFDHLKDKWIKLYNSGYSLKEIADKDNVFPQTVHTYIKDEVTMREYSETSKVYDIKDDYFDEINTKEKAYFLGLFFSTGSLIAQKRNYAVQLVTKEYDLDRMEAFKNAINTDKPLDVLGTEQNPVHYLRIGNKKLYHALKKHGLTLRKTTSLKFPHSVPNHLLSSFVLGYYEGKGSCYISSNKNIKLNKVYSSVYLSFSGTEAFLMELNNIFEKELGITLIMRKESYGEYANYDGEYNVLTTGKREYVSRIAKWLYTEQKVYSQKRDIRKKLSQAKA